MIPLKEYRTTIKGFPDLLQYAAMVGEGVILNKCGSLLSGFFFRGPDMGSSTDTELSVMSAQLNAALIKLGSGWMFHIDSFRTPSKSYIGRDECHFPDPVTNFIDEERRSRHDTEGTHYENSYAILFTYKPAPDVEEKLTCFFV